ncbi:hypothetical protein ACSMXM_05930 [Pacificimonas sp. ICDLI1SI03]
MPTTTTNKEINSAKADMSYSYGHPDPRNYFRELQKVDYRIPELAKPVFTTLIQHLEERKNAPVHALDVGCSYGVNAALLKHDLKMDDLYARWTDPALDAATPEQMTDADRRFFSALPVANPAAIYGLDPSAPAISYGENTGLLDRGMAVNLEEDELSDVAADTLAPVDLVMSTGCVGYVTEISFAKMIPAFAEGRLPWMANFVLRMFPFDPIVNELGKHGYVTEKLEGEQFIQRAFASAEEQEGVLDKLKAQGLDSSGESEGNLIAEFYLSRPAQDATVPLRELAIT